MQHSSTVLRWGILGAAAIARKNWQAIRRSGNGEIRAVASRDAARAGEWIAQCQGEHPFPRIPDALGSYEALLERGDIDAVYIPLPTGIRKDWVIRAARAGKHVLCEKPCGASAAEVEEMTAACREAGVQFMDGVMYLHSDRLAALRRTLDDGESVGRIKRVAAQFSFMAPEEFFTSNIRADAALEPLGCLGDLGWYTIRFALWALGWEMPSEVTGRLIASAGAGEGVPVEFSAELVFPSGPTAGFYCSFQTEHQQWVHVSGTRGSVELRDFVLPYYGNELAYRVSRPVFAVDNCEFRMERHDKVETVAEYSNSHATAQETKLFRRFAELALSGQPDEHWPRVALQTQRVMDACLRSARRGGAPVDPRDAS